MGMCEGENEKYYKFSIYIELLYQCYIIYRIMDMEKHTYVVSANIIIMNIVECYLLCEP